MVEVWHHSWDLWPTNNIYFEPVRFHGLYIINWNSFKKMWNLFPLAKWVKTQVTWKVEKMGKCVCPLPTWLPGVEPGGNGLQCPGSPLTGRSRSGGSALCSFHSRQSPGCPLSTGTHLTGHNGAQDRVSIEDKTTRESIINERKLS